MEAAKIVENLGCNVREVTLSPLADWAACGSVILNAEAYAIHEANLRTRFTDYGEIFRDRMVLAGLITGADYVQALRLRRELVDELEAPAFRTSGHVWGSDATPADRTRPT